MVALTEVLMHATTLLVSAAYFTGFVPADIAAQALVSLSTVYVAVSYVAPLIASLRASDRLLPGWKDNVTALVEPGILEPAAAILHIAAQSDTEETQKVYWTVSNDMEDQEADILADSASDVLEPTSSHATHLSPQASLPALTWSSFSAPASSPVSAYTHLFTTIGQDDLSPIALLALAAILGFLAGAIPPLSYIVLKSKNTQARNIERLSQQSFRHRSLSYQVQLDPQAEPESLVQQAEREYVVDPGYEVKLEGVLEDEKYTESQQDESAADVADTADIPLNDPAPAGINPSTDILPSIDFPITDITSSTDITPFTKSSTLPTLPTTAVPSTRGLDAPDDSTPAEDAAAPSCQDVSTINTQGASTSNAQCASTSNAQDAFTTYHPEPSAPSPSDASTSSALLPSSSTHLPSLSPALSQVSGTPENTSIEQHPITCAEDPATTSAVDVPPTGTEGLPATSPEKATRTSSVQSTSASTRLGQVVALSEDTDAKQLEGPVNASASSSQAASTPSPQPLTLTAPPSPISSQVVALPDNASFELSTVSHVPASHVAALPVSKSTEQVPTIADFTLDRTLGGGSGGIVRLAKHKATARTVAIKMVHKKLCAHPDIRKTVLAEQRVLARVAKEAAQDETKHPFIAKLHMSFHDEHSVYLVLESYVCDLDARIDYYVSKKRKFPRDLLRFYVAEICAGIAGLHAMGIAHRDVKPGNVLVDTEGHVVLADFGLAVGAGVTVEAGATSEASGAKETSLSHPSATLMCTEEVGSRYFMAPEILLGSPYNAYAADWWSVGAVMWNMWTGKPPFADAVYNACGEISINASPTEIEYRYIHVGDLLRNFTTDPEHALVAPEDMEENDKSMLLGLLQRDPRLRLNDSAIQHHEFILSTRYTWDAIATKQTEPPPAQGDKRYGEASDDAALHSYKRKVENAPKKAKKKKKNGRKAIPEEDLFAEYMFVNPRGMED